ncbi:MAG: VOC family protein [Pseudomonadales bacterium]
MKSTNPVLCLAIIFTFGCAIVDRTALAEEGKEVAKVTGIGGIFFLSRGEGKALSSWYKKHLGMRLEDFGAAILKWEDDTAEDNGVTVWHVADSDSDWFSPSKSSFMVNYRVDDLEAMVEQLKQGGIDILKGPEYHENGVFAWIMDPEGNKIELWEPKIWDEKNKK